MTEKDTSAAGQTGGIFLYAGYNKLLAASFLGALGDRFYQAIMIATTSAIFLKDTANVQAGRVQIFSIIPMLILYAFVGSIVDGFNRRRLLAGLEGIKIVVVLGFALLLGRVINYRASNQLPDEWNWALWLVVLMNIFTVPFGPARMAVVPDVLPVERRSMGASLVATAGLFTYLVGSTGGIILASPGKLGPVYMSMIASGIYLASTLLFAWMPDATAVPGNQRKSEAHDGGEHAAPKKMSVGEYFYEQWDGLKYVLSRPAIIGLIFFETMFWSIASSLLALLFFYGSDVLGVSGDAKNNFIGVSLGLAGIGLFGGALGVGKLAYKVSPIITYTLGFILVYIGFQYVFAGEAVSIAKTTGKFAAGLPGSFYPLLGCLALGGGMLLGRVDADVLAFADERFRGRIFALKAIAFASCTLGTQIWINEVLKPAGKFELMLTAPQVLFWMIPLVFVFAWFVDAAIWSRKTDFHAPTFMGRMQFRLCRFILLCWIKINFRFSAEGAENIPEKGPVILAANHGSFLDPVFLGCGSPRMVQFLMYRSYYTSFAHPLFRFLSAIPVDEKKYLLALKTGIASLEEGCCIGIFPEGMVAHRPELNPAQGGFILMAQKTGAPIVPVALKGDWDALPRGAIFPRFKKVTAIFGKPFTVSKDLSKQETAELTDKMMADLGGILGVPPPVKKEEAKS